MKAYTRQTFEQYMTMTNTQLIDRWNLLKRIESKNISQHGVIAFTLRDENLEAALTNRQLWKKIQLYFPTRRNEMSLTFKAVEREEYNVRSFKDRRFIVNRVTVSYTDEQGNEYRKSFESRTRPDFPQVTDHEHAAEIRYQYSE